MFLRAKNYEVILKTIMANCGFLDFLFRFFYVNIMRVHFKCSFYHIDVKTKSFIFECFRGRMVNDSPLSIYNALLKSDFKGNYTWVLSSTLHPLYEFLGSKENTNIVIYGTKEYFQAYASSQYWIVNCRIPFRVVKKENQKFVQCWHGTPLKMMGYDIKTDNDVRVSKLGLKYAYSLETRQIDYFISPSDYASKCFSSSFGLEKSQILQLGYPRNDAIFDSHSNVNLIKKLKGSIGIPVDKTVILYAPTYRDNSYCNQKQKHTLNNPLESIDFLNRFNDDYIFLYRGHYFTDLENESSQFIDISSYDNVNDLYLIADLLITDYSSVFFDYAILNKPILFFMYDREEYESKIRGFYLDIDKGLPGEICVSLSSLADNVLLSLNKKHDLSDFNEIYNPYEDGLSTERVINAIMNNNGS